MNWKQAFQNTLKKTKLPIFLKIIGYVILFMLVGQIVKFLGYPDDFLVSLIIVSLLLFIVQFSFALIQEKNKK